MKRTPLKRGKGLRRSSIKAAPKVDKNEDEQSESRIPPEVILAVRTRSRDRCEARSWQIIRGEPCQGRGEHFHHRKLRKQGGPDTFANLMHVCFVHHIMIHHFPGVSYNRGFMVHAWMPNEKIEPWQEAA